MLENRIALKNCVLNACPDLYWYKMFSNVCVFVWYTGGHLDVVQLLVNAGADIDSQDNRKVSCLMAAFRKGHVKVVKWMVKHVTQFPGDPECIRYINTINDKVELNKHNQDVSTYCRFNIYRGSHMGLENLENEKTFSSQGFLNRLEKSGNFTKILEK